MYGSDVIELSSSQILERVSELSIFQYYIGPTYQLGTIVCSPLREDTNPSFGVFKGRGGTFELLYKDLASGECGNCFTFIMSKFKCKYTEALLIIDNDFRLGLVKKEYKNASLEYFGIPELTHVLKIPAKKLIQVKRREWNSAVDKAFWSKYHITCEVLNKYEVSPITHAWIDEKLLWVEYPKMPIYAYRLGTSMYKLYKPYEKRGRKWIGNPDTGNLQGYNQLPWVGDSLIITKSLKDVMVLSVLGYNAVATHSESTGLDPVTLKTLEDRFKDITIFYDNDQAGITGAKKLCRAHDFNGIIIPLEYEVKDISDFIVKYGYQDTRELLQRLL